MDEQANPLDKTAIACGVVALVIGVFIVLSAFGIIPSRGSSGGGRWIGVIAGMAFVFGGLAVVIQTCAKASPDGVLPSNAPAWVGTTLYLLSVAIVMSLGAIGTWIAFGPGEREFTRAGRDLVAIGIGEVLDLPPDRSLDIGAARREFAQRALLALLGEVGMGDGVRADRDQGIGGKGLQFIPGHAEFARNRRLVDAVANA